MSVKAELARTLQLSDLPKGITETEVREFLAANDQQIEKLYLTGGKAFVLYPSEESAKLAMNYSSGTEISEDNLVEITLSERTIHSIEREAESFVNLSKEEAYDSDEEKRIMEKLRSKSIDQDENHGIGSKIPTSGDNETRATIFQEESSEAKKETPEVPSTTSETTTTPVTTTHVIPTTSSTNTILGSAITTPFQRNPAVTSALGAQLLVANAESRNHYKAMLQSLPLQPRAHLNEKDAIYTIYNGRTIALMTLAFILFLFVTRLIERLFGF